MTSSRALSRAVSVRNRTVHATTALSVALVAGGVVVAVAADPLAAADRIRPLSEMVDVAFLWIRGLDRTQLAIGGLVAALLYAIVAVAVSHVRGARTAALKIDDDNGGSTGSSTSELPHRRPAATTRRKGGPQSSQQARALLARGATRAEIARKTGLSQDALSLVLGAPAPTMAKAQMPAMTGTSSARPTTRRLDIRLA